MPFKLLADLVVITHLAFILFVVVGGFLVLKWRKLIWIHVPVAIWGALIEFTGWICPLTPLENYLRNKAGLNTYSGDFIGEYILPLIYPHELTRSIQLILGSLVLVLNILAYVILIVRTRKLK